MTKDGVTECEQCDKIGGKYLTIVLVIVLLIGVLLGTVIYHHISLDDKEEIPKWEEGVEIKGYLSLPDSASYATAWEEPETSSVIWHYSEIINILNYTNQWDSMRIYVMADGTILAIEDIGVLVVLDNYEIGDYIVYCWEWDVNW